jgi:hypothetical protein
MTDALDVIEPQLVQVTYLGQLLSIHPLTIGQLPRMVRTSRALIDAVFALESIPDNDNVALLTLVMDLLEAHGEALCIAAAIATGTDENWIAKGDVAEFVELARAVIEVNRDFFVQRLARLLAARATAASGGGTTASSS